MLFSDCHRNPDCHRNRLTPVMVSLALSLTVMTVTNGADTPGIPKQLAGKTLAAWVDDLNQGDLRTRLVAVRTLHGFAAPADASLLQACMDQHAAVRFWALTALGDRATGNPETFQSLLKDSSHPVRVAAAYALCRLKINPQAFDLLQTALAHPSRGLPIFSANWLGKIGSPLATEALSTGAKHKDYHVRNACRQALKAIQQAGQMP